MSELSDRLRKKARDVLSYREYAAQHPVDQTCIEREAADALDAKDAELMGAHARIRQLENPDHDAARVGHIEKVALALIGAIQRGTVTDPATGEPSYYNGRIDELYVAIADLRAAPNPGAAP